MFVLFFLLSFLCFLFFGFLGSDEGTGDEDATRLARRRCSACAPEGGALDDYFDGDVKIADLLSKAETS